MKKFKPVDQKIEFPKMEEGILKYWKDNDVFNKTVEKRKGKKPFVFYEGPPTANGRPGSHHVEARAFKDLIPRYKTMQGYYCERKGGWDCHGLPVEIEVEKKLKISGKQQIEDFSIEKFNKLCQESVFEYVEEWEKLTERIGFWIDIKSSYETMDNNFIESGWAILKELSNHNLLYEDYKVVPYCARCGTPLSTHELALGYKDNVQDTSVYVLFKLTDNSRALIRNKLIEKKGLTGKHQLPEFSSLDFNLVAWTTTPWTLPGNVGLAVDSSELYGVYLDATANNVVIGSIKTVDFWKKGGFEKVGQLLGEDLLMLDYEPIYNFVKYDKKAHFVVPADFVSSNEGTGIVHTAVMYGEDDFNLGNKYNLPKKHVVNEKGEFVADVTPWKGMFVKKADPLIIKDLENRRFLFKKEDILHTYPYCWRCGTPLLYYALTSWYLKTTAVKENLLKNNESVNWTPAHIKDGRMGEWLKNNKDWAVSRSRYWGTPLPIWRCQKCAKVQVVGSVNELSNLSGTDQAKLDLHRPFVDKVKWKCECGGEFNRLPFVLDCWFDSGAMPYAQWHYPFENKEKFKEQFPADYICEAMDQTRGWFYTLQAVATLLGKPSPYKNVICLGLILDEKGNKMSKSKGNVVDPWMVVGDAGADALRWYVYSVITPGESFRFSLNLVKDVNRQFLLILWNIYNFFVTYANLTGWKKVESTHILDKWILVCLDKLVADVTNKLDNYDIFGSTGQIQKFVADLSTWYIRRSRDRQTSEFFSTCYEVLVTLCKLLAPFTPFISEEIYRNLTGEESVHLAEWPKSSESVVRSSELIEQMQSVRSICEQGHAQRKLNNLKVRQPLQKITIDKEFSEDLLQLIKDELNVKDVVNGDKVELDTKLSRELVAEGKARDLVRDIQSARKTAGTALDEKIVVELPDWPKEHEDYIKRQTLATSLKKGDKLQIIRS